MSISNAIFTRNILSSEDAFRQFFTGEKALQDISALSDRDKVTPYKPTPYYNRWQVAWIIVSLPFKGIGWLFLKAVEKIAQCTGARNLSIRCNLQADRQIEDFANIVILGKGRYYGKNLLARSYNRHQIETSDLYLQSPKRIDSVEWLKNKDKSWINDAFQTPHHIRFFHPKGLCKGASQWFFYLYMHTLDKPFSSPHARIQAVCRQFEKGMSREPALLQSLFVEGSAQVLSFKFPDKNLKLDPQILATPNGKKLIEDMPIGNHYVSFITHIICYFKINDQLGFIFDPNIGAICFEGEQHSQQVADFFKLYAHKDNEIMCWQLDKSDFHIEQNQELSAV